MKAKWCMNCKNLESYEIPWIVDIKCTCNYCKKHPEWDIKINSIVKGCKDFIYKYKKGGK